MDPKLIRGHQVQGVNEKVSYSNMYNTSFCSRVRLTHAEFNNFTFALAELNLSESGFTYDLVQEGNETRYLLCAEDFQKIPVTDACSSVPTDPEKTGPLTDYEDTWTSVGVVSIVCTCVSLVSLLCVIVTYIALPSLREGTGLSTLAMACVLFVAQALHEFGLEQYEVDELCLTLAVLIHFCWLSAVFMMTACTLQLFNSLVRPLKARMAASSRRMVVVSLAGSFCLSVLIIGATMAANRVVHSHLGYPARYLCFLRTALSRQLAFGLPLGLAVVLNVVLFVVSIVHLKRRPQLSSTRQDQVSLVACFRLSVITGACWLSLFLLAVPGTRPWLEYVAVVLLGLQGLLLATTLLLTKRVYKLWKQFFARRKNQSSAAHLHSNNSNSNSGPNKTTSKDRLLQTASTKLSSVELSSKNSSVRSNQDKNDSTETKENSPETNVLSCRL